MLFVIFVTSDCILSVNDILLADLLTLFFGCFTGASVLLSGLLFGVVVDGLVAVEGFFIVIFRERGFSSVVGCGEVRVMLLPPTVKDSGWLGGGEMLELGAPPTNCAEDGSAFFFPFLVFSFSGPGGLRRRGLVLWRI